MAEPIVTLDNVSQIFTTRRGEIAAVDAISLAVEPGAVVCLVGESGSGKTTAGKMVAGLRPPTRGAVRYKGRDIWKLDKQGFRQYRRAVQIVHQDPYASLNPIHTVFTTLSVPLRRHGGPGRTGTTRQQVSELLTRVGLTPPETFIAKYPHQLSGGQRQRVSIARALTVNPRLIVADEATSMIDVSLRVSMLNTLRQLRDDLGVAFIFITHDLAIAKYFAWEGHIAVMYLGRIVEYGRTPTIINDAQHPYTRALLAAIPEPDPDLTRAKKAMELRSPDIPNLLEKPSGCSFHPRCPRFEAGLCDVEVPELVDIGGARFAACHVVARERTGDIATVAADRLPVAATTIGERR